MAHGNHGATHHEGGAHHPTPMTYLKVAATLVGITLVEVAAFYVPSLRGILIPMLFILSAVKFAVVVMFYMHLKFDSKLFSGLFVGCLLLALAIVTALIGLFHKGLLLH